MSTLMKTRISPQFETSVLGQLLCEIEILSLGNLVVLDKICELETQEQRIRYLELIIENEESK